MFFLDLARDPRRLIPLAVLACVATIYALFAIPAAFGISPVVMGYTLLAVATTVALYVLSVRHGDKIFWIGIFLFVLAGMFYAPAFAADAAPAPDPVALPWGDWLVAALTCARDTFVLVASAAVARFAPSYVRQFLTDRVLANAIDYAIASVAGVAKGQVIDIPHINDVLDEAERYAVANAPAVAKRIADTLRPKLLARLSAAMPLPADATVGVPGSITKPKIDAALPDPVTK